MHETKWPMITRPQTGCEIRNTRDQIFLSDLHFNQHIRWQLPAYLLFRLTYGYTMLIISTSRPTHHLLPMLWRNYTHKFHAWSAGGWRQATKQTGTRHPPTRIKLSLLTPSISFGLQIPRTPPRKKYRGTEEVGELEWLQL